ncbi:MAG TPA: hypothetical protein VMC09_16575 [Anaerolineales bacterium]|nr:hypothetical protein [Anaerolineales bacterium]
MNRTRIFAHLFLAALVALASALFLPFSGQKVSAAPPADVVANLVLSRVTSLPSKMCVGATANLVFSYTLTSLPYGKPGRDYENKAIVSSSAVTGEINPPSLSIYASTGSGTFNFIYEAKKAGTDVVTISASSGSLSGSKDYKVRVLDCNKKVTIAASIFKQAQYGTADAFLNATGGVQVADSGSVTGGGTFDYTFSMSYAPDDPSTICDKSAKTSGKSTFTISGDSDDNGQISISFDFAPFNLPPVVVNCTDKSGKTFQVTLVKGQNVTPNNDVNLGTLSFGAGVESQNFKFGEGGQGSVWVVDKTGSSQ